MNHVAQSCHSPVLIALSVAVQVRSAGGLDRTGRRRWMQRQRVAEVVLAQQRGFPSWPGLGKFSTVRQGGETRRVVKIATGNYLQIMGPAPKTPWDTMESTFWGALEDARVQGAPSAPLSAEAELTHFLDEQKKMSCWYSASSWQVESEAVLN